MWEKAAYKLQKQTGSARRKGNSDITINVTYSAPATDVPGIILEAVFERITEGLDPKKTKVLDVGAGKLRNTFWFLQHGFEVWAVEFPELRDRLASVKQRWKSAEDFSNFHKVSFPCDFLVMKEKFDLILLINVINVMPIPFERLALISMCRDKLKDKGKLFWHHWRARTVHPDDYTDKNAFIDGFLKGKGPNHTFYVEYDKDQTHELLYALGFAYTKDLPLYNVQNNGKANFSYVFEPDHEVLIPKMLDIPKLLATINDGSAIPKVEQFALLDLYIKEMKTVKAGPTEAHKYHLLASRIFFEIFRNQLGEPNIEQEINEGRGRIDISYKNRNKEGIFKDAKEMRDIPCPEIMVECKNYEYDLTNKEYAQLADRLSPQRGMLGFLLCRDKKDEEKVVKHCRDRQKGGNNKYIIVLDDGDLEKLATFKLYDEDDSSINEFIDKKIKQIID